MYDYIDSEYLILNWFPCWNSNVCVSDSMCFLLDFTKDMCMYMSWSWEVRILMLILKVNTDLKGWLFINLGLDLWMISDLEPSLCVQLKNIRPWVTFQSFKGLFRAGFFCISLLFQSSKFLHICLETTNKYNYYFDFSRQDFCNTFFFQSIHFFKIFKCRPILNTTFWKTSRTILKFVSIRHLKVKIYKIGKCFNINYVSLEENETWNVCSWCLVLWKYQHWSTSVFSRYWASNLRKTLLCELKSHA